MCVTLNLGYEEHLYDLVWFQMQAKTASRILRGQTEMSVDYPIKSQQQHPPQAQKLCSDDLARLIHIMTIGSDTTVKPPQ